jgi:hypothetical protein
MNEGFSLVAIEKFQIYLVTATCSSCERKREKEIVFVRPQKFNHYSHSMGHYTW